MPNKPKRPCGHSGCNILTDNGYCDKHTKERDHLRGSAASRGYGHDWRIARARYLQQHPLCVHCERDGRVTPAKHVDHIVPHRGDDRLFWDMSNWQALCHSCHSIKTATEDGGFGREVRG